jgi:prophage regulatory protein
MQCEQVAGSGMNRILRIAEVETLTGLRRSTLWRLWGTGDFPRPVQIGKRAIGFSAEAVEEWINARLAGSATTPPKLTH